MNPLSGQVIAALRNGKIREANRLLGSDYSLTGRVAEGNKLGRTIGFPTANLSFEDNKPVHLANGVYAVYVSVLGLTMHGIANIGTRPTLNLKQLSVEVHIFDFDQDLYGEILTVYFVERIRDEKKFPGILELTEQISRDVAIARTLSGTGNHPDAGA